MREIMVKITEKMINDGYASTGHKKNPGARYRAQTYGDHANDGGADHAHMQRSVKSKTLTFYVPRWTDYLVEVKNKATIIISL